MMIVDTAFIRDLQDHIDREPPGPERELAQAKLDRVIELLEEMPRKVAQQGPFATAAEARAVLEREVAVVIAALDG
ncbi:hypothetical protein [Bradyrhizobium sp.]|jgi:hypothetical protein|uniref:hypothetical protein n=1 Tax=Bradyrhizobium sp. TaxID=376 RepID=UPI003BB1E812